MSGRRTVVAIEEDRFLVDGQPTYPGRWWRGLPIEGLLLNARLVQATFDDLNPQTRSWWDYPDGGWDPDRNTRQFVEQMPAWRAAGLIGFTVNFQGGSPRGYSKDQPWHNSAFEADGTLRPDYCSRMEAVLDRADELGMVPIVGLFYFGQDERLESEAAVLRAADAAVDWLVDRRYTHVVVEVANEVNVPKYEHEVLTDRGAHRLIERIQQRSQGRIDAPARRLLVSTSMGGGAIPPDPIIDAGDFVLLHGNGVKDPDRIRGMVETVRGRPAYRRQPVLFNEDDHFEFDQPDNNMVAAISRYAGWGLFDYRMQGEGFEQGYQSVPVDWATGSARKRGFFRLLAEVTGGQAPA
jgi:hypothetical protein